MPNINAYISAEIRDAKTGKLIRKVRRKVCKSFVNNFMELIYTQMAQTNVNIVRVTGATASALVNNAPLLSVLALETDATYGLLVGIGTDTPLATDYKLQTQIAEGSTTGQLHHGLTSTLGTISNTTGSTLSLLRNLSNQTANDITVHEVALYCLVCIFISPTYYYVPVCILHDLYSLLIPANTVALLGLTIETTV
jgi:hypothetical protein